MSGIATGRTARRTQDKGRRLRHAAVAAVLAGVVLPASARAAAPQTKIDSGVIIGTEQGDIAAFLGIPYAAPPVGPLRFRPPQPVAPWKTPLATTAVSGYCSQARAGVAMGSEDCLYLNVWTRRPPDGKPVTGKRPVMVFIHGGGYQAGSGSYPYYGGRILAEKGDVVVVTLNYRLGALGFLTSPALDAESPSKVSGNYGILDQQAAIRWVHDNIAAFGGDPRKVTLFGESGGGISVEHALVSPLLAPGLFQRAIIESAIGVQSLPTLAQSETGFSAGIIQKVGCAGTADLAACLRAVPNDRFNLFPTPLTPGTAHDVIDGVVLPRQTLAAFRSGQFTHVPIIIGTTHDEFTFAVWPLEMPPNAPVLTAAAYAARLDALYGPRGPTVLAEYPASAYRSPIQALAAVETDSAAACYNLKKYAALDQYVPTFAYELNEPNPARGWLQGPPVAGLTYGDVHTSDLTYVFGYAEPPNGTAPEVTGKDVPLRDIVMSYWTNMAKSGDPNVPVRDAARPYWPNFTSQQLLSLKDEPSLLPISAFSKDHHCAFWNTVPPPPPR